jgi:hypothetical protein
VGNVAIPLAFKVPLPICVVESKKAAVPVGTPLPDVGVTVAVNVTDWPETDGFSNEANVVLVEVAVAAACVTARACVPTVIVAVRGDVFGFAAMV